MDLAEEIINLLAHVPELKVTARTSAFAFRGKEQDITTRSPRRSASGRFSKAASAARALGSA